MLAGEGSVDGLGLVGVEPRRAGALQHRSQRRAEAVAQLAVARLACWQPLHVHDLPAVEPLAFDLLEESVGFHF